jgi:hypothetical protein
MNNNKEVLTMKKLLLLAAVAALTMNVALWGQSITVTSPASGNEWCLGSTQTITWIKSGTMPATVAVRLRRAGAPETELAVVDITGSTANNGSISWTIPVSVPVGDYFIRIRTSSPDVIGDSATFKIKSCYTKDRDLPLPYPKNRPIPKTIIESMLACKVSGISLSPQDSVQRGSPLTAYVTGKGICAAFRINWGDGSPLVVVNNTNFDALPSGLPLTHTYGYWCGWKTVTVEGISPCVGKVLARVLVEPKVYKLAFMQDAKTGGGGIVPNVPEVRKNAIVTITTGPSKIDFGCFLGGCIYGPNGEPGSVAPADYPFPGLRKYSLVIRLGSQVVQGSYSFTFVANQTAMLEVFANDNVLGDNSGGWGVWIEVDESGL